LSTWTEESEHTAPLGFSDPGGLALMPVCLQDGKIRLYNNKTMTQVGLCSQDYFQEQVAACSHLVN
jgi:hypothetical protein